MHLNCGIHKIQFVHTRSYIYICISNIIHVYLHTYSLLDMHVWIFSVVHTHINIDAHKQACTHISLYDLTCMEIHRDISLSHYLNTHTNVYHYICTHICRVLHTLTHRWLISYTHRKAGSQDPACDLWDRPHCFIIVTCVLLIFCPVVKSFNLIKTLETK